MSVEQILSRLRMDHRFMQNVTAWERLPARAASYAEFPPGLDQRLIDALRSRGTAPLYIHQVESVKAALAGQNVVVVTGTASGKTLCYNLPVLQTLLSDPQARALYLFPTKALAQDQSAALGEFLAVMGISTGIQVRTYDGDTIPARRRTIRDEVHILLSNPDMLHMGILPHHQRWSEFFENLKYIVLDELHVYRGIFGSNVANLLRRVRRICAFYGSDPQFILTSATIANPKELAERLIDAEVRLIPADIDGAPRAEKQVIIYNPPVIDPALGIRRSYILEAARVSEHFLKAEIQTVVFARARSTTEVLLGYVRDSFAAEGGDPMRIRGYRGGYLPLERREIETGLRSGDVLGVVATNALELGVDIGQLGAAIVAGYPGTIASMWQQTGRAGRRSETSAAILIASAAPLDQFVATHPTFLFERAPEQGLINPDNLAILLRHIRCAAFELPFQRGESFGSAGDIQDILEFLAEEQVLHAGETSYHWLADNYPAQDVSLRASTDDTIVIQCLHDDRVEVIGEVDRSTAPILIHEGAIYIHEGRTYIVQKLDWEQAIAEVQPAEVDFYTDAGESVDVEILNVDEAEEEFAARKAHGRILVTAETTSFRKVKRYTHETLGYGRIDLPAREFETIAFWLWIAPEVTQRLEQEGVLLPPNDYGPSWPAARSAVRQRDGFRCRQCNAPEKSGRAHDVHHLRPFREFGYVAGENQYDRLANEPDNLITLCAACHHRTESARGTRSALAGFSYALSNIAPLFLMCDPRDIGAHVELRSAEYKCPTITLYDRVPDGLGLSERLYAHSAELLRGALDLVSQCQCEDGCPVCVGPVGIGGQQVKEMTQRLIQVLLDHET